MDLPVDIRLEILQHLDRPQLLQSCLTSPQWNEVCRDNSLWRRFVREDFGEVKMVESWYHTYRYWYERLMRLAQVLIDEGSTLDLEIVDEKKLRQRVYDRLKEEFKRYYRANYESADDYYEEMNRTTDEMYDILTGIQVPILRWRNSDYGRYGNDYLREYNNFSKYTIVQVLLTWFFVHLVYINPRNDIRSILQVISNAIGTANLVAQYNLLLMDRQYVE